MTERKNNHRIRHQRTCQNHSDPGRGLQTSAAARLIHHVNRPCSLRGISPGNRGPPQKAQNPEIRRFGPFPGDLGGWRHCNRLGVAAGTILPVRIPEMEPWRLVWERLGYGRHVFSFILLRNRLLPKSRPWISPTMGRKPPGTPLILFPGPGYIEISKGEPAIFHLTPIS